MESPPGFDAATPRDEARRRLARAFADGGLPSADLDARVLLCAALGIDHAALVRDPAAPVGANAGLLGGFAARRLRHEPVSRIIGYREFWGARFALGPAALDPRPDTEALVETVLDHIGGGAGKAWRLLDLGVGSGAILGALLYSLPKAWGVGVDVAPNACAIARNNLAANGFDKRASIICADWTAALCGAFDIVVCNPPYIRAGDIAGLPPEVLSYDPLLALDGGPDGVDCYRAVIPGAAALLAPKGLLALEIGPGQGDDVADLLRNACFLEPKFRLDLGFRERIIFSCLA